MKPFLLTAPVALSLALLLQAQGPNAPAVQPGGATQPEPSVRPGAKSSPPKDAPATPPKADVDPKIAAPTTNTPNGPKSTRKDKNAVKPVPPAPSEPGNPGVRPL